MGSTETHSWETTGPNPVLGAHWAQEGPNGLHPPRPLCTPKAVTGRVSGTSEVLCQPRATIPPVAPPPPPEPGWRLSSGLCATPGCDISPFPRASLCASQEQPSRALVQGLSRTITRPPPRPQAPESQRVQPQVSCLALALSHPPPLLSPPLDLPLPRERTLPVMGPFAPVTCPYQGPPTAHKRRHRVGQLGLPLHSAGAAGNWRAGRRPAGRRPCGCPRGRAPAPGGPSSGAGTASPRG